MASPTELREWNSTAGTSIKAIARNIEGGQVSLQTEDGRDLKVPLDKLKEADQEFLRNHFAISIPKAGEPVGSGLAAVEGLSQPLGKVSSPIDAGNGSSYLLYLPTTLKEGRKGPVIFWTHSGGGKPNLVDYMRIGAEANGWIVAVSVEGRNGNGDAKNHEHTKNCLEHIFANFPVDQERVYL